MTAYIAECKAAGLDPKEVTRIARGLSRYAKEASDMGLTVFGGSGGGSLRTYDSLVLAQILDGHFDGGDGATRLDNQGLERGESYFQDGGQ